MHPTNYGFYCCFTKEEPTLEELKAKVIEINVAIDCISTSDLSNSVKALAINELHSKKENLKELMHKKVDEL